MSNALNLLCDAAGARSAVLGNAFSTNSMRKNLIIEREAANERGERSVCKISVNTRKKLLQLTICWIITLQISALEFF